MRRAALRVAPALAALLLAGCVLPDRDIVIVDEAVQNKHPVRFIEPTPVSFDAAATCLALLDEQDLKSAVCQPSDPEYNLPAYLDPELVEFNEDGEEIKPYRFCSCDPDKADSRRLRATTLYVEDRRDDVGEPLRHLYAALQLDISPGETEPQRKVAYASFVDPKLLLPESTREYEPPRRPPSAAGRELHEINLGFSGGRLMDLCNDAGQPLARGFHTLRVIVTDAPWFIPAPEEPDTDTESSIVEPVGEMERQIGVPDIANGATYDAMTFTFFCGRYQAASGDSPVVDAHCEAQCITLEDMQ